MPTPNPSLRGGRETFYVHYPECYSGNRRGRMGAPRIREYLAHSRRLLSSRRYFAEYPMVGSALGILAESPVVGCTLGIFAE